MNAATIWFCSQNLNFNSGISYDQSSSRIRSATKEQVESLGGNFIQVEENDSGETKEGYAKEMSASYKKKQSKLLESTCNVITYDNYKYVKTSETSKTLKKIPDTDNPITTCYFLKSN